MWVKLAVHIIKELLMTEHSLTPPMTVGNHWNFICGVGQMIKGFDAAVADMEVGQSVDVHLMPEEAYGMPDSDAVFTLEIAQLPGSEDLEAGQRVYLTNQLGQPFPVSVVKKNRDYHYF